MAAKQEVTAEEELTVKTQARAPSAGVVLQVTGCLVLYLGLAPVHERVQLDSTSWFAC